MVILKLQPETDALFLHANIEFLKWPEVKHKLSLQTRNSDKENVSIVVKVHVIPAVSGLMFQFNHSNYRFPPVWNHLITNYVKCNGRIWARKYSRG